MKFIMMAIRMGETTRLAKANSRSESLRTTVPSGIVKQFDMKEGDALNWTIDIKGSKLIIEISPVKQDRVPISGKKRKGSKTVLSKDNGFDG